MALEKNVRISQNFIHWTPYLIQVICITYGPRGSTSDVSTYSMHVAVALDFFCFISWQAIQNGKGSLKDCGVNLLVLKEKSGTCSSKINICTNYMINHLIVDISIWILPFNLIGTVTPLYPENVPVELREPLYKDQYEQEHLKPSVSKLLLSPEIYCRVQALLAQAHGVSPPVLQGSPTDSSALLQFLVKKGFAPKVQDADVTEEDLSYIPIKMVGVASFVAVYVCVWPIYTFIPF